MTKELKTIDGTEALMEYLKQESPHSIGIEKKGFWDRKNRVVRKVFKKIKFTGNFHDIEFRSVKFIECEFKGVYGFYCNFSNCVFNKCSLTNSRFTHFEFGWYGVEFHDSFLRNIEIDEGSVSTMIFLTSFIASSNFSGLFLSENIRFYDCTIEDTNFLSVTHYELEEEVKRDDEYIDLLFEDCVINNSTFQETDFRNSRLVNSVLFKSAFIGCVLDNECFMMDKELQYDSFASIDFQTILKSGELSEGILSTYFKINSKTNIKKTVSRMTNQVKFSTVFISYSFKDSLIAERINTSLNREGIRTFLWKKDAPGGKPLEEIMSAGISSHDKLLFIASENSIKSKACQFELTAARKKQEQSWQNVFFPIMIDDFIFKVKKSQIRPIEYADDYWKNIEEIRNVNMLDFTEFTTDVYDEDMLGISLRKIVEGLSLDL
ncbi:MAG: hypothetical protein BGO31_20580 [Bacteroidetes bacterium 43-16]|uniref:TIR domain-containing protein n=1 Tax=uncultured Dysgonomonas sp. TaxID=206096 RepID=UPI000925D14B|nr:TIR domain-containing protein [uncultured Dysgonomonas sp.]OJV55330.1 MAG: hypothetical protein BGO31_20580 [Bacteroidetes bacterium 43-16]